jgi:hypothetical protein
MKKLILLFTLCSVALAQSPQFAAPSGNGNCDIYAKKMTYNGTSYTYSNFQDKTFSATLDTLQPLTGISQYTNLYITLASKDSISALVYARFSLDGGTFGAYALLDSLKENSDTPALKSINFTTNAGGFPVVQFYIDVNAKAYALGKTTPTYSIKYQLKR